MRFTAATGESVHEIDVTRRDGVYVVTVDGAEHLVDARKLEADFYSILVGGVSYEVSVEPAGGRYVLRHGAHEQTVALVDASRSGRDDLARRGGREEILSVMPGKVVRVLVAAGDAVDVGSALVVVEAMKMENEIAAPRAGTVVEVAVEAGQTVETGARLVVLE